MIEKTVLDYLNNQLSTIPAYMEKPEKIPVSYVIIQKTGGGMENQIWHGTFAIQSIAASLYEASALNDAVIAAMLNITETEDISACTLNSNYNYTDTRTKEYRYQAVFDLAW